MWRYTCNIPLWIQGKDADGESVAVSACRRARAPRARRRAAAPRRSLLAGGHRLLPCLLVLLRA